MSKDPIARKMRLRRGRRDQEEADQDQAKILKVSLYIFLRYQPYLCCWCCSPTFISFEFQSDILFYFCLTLLGVQILMCAGVSAPYMGKNPLTPYFLSSYDISDFCARNEDI
jgi:hypothetical protein